MKSSVAAYLVLCGMAGSAWGQTKEPAKQPPAEPKKITVDLGGGVKMEMTLIPAGEFMMEAASQRRPRRNSSTSITA